MKHRLAMSLLVVAGCLSASEHKQPGPVTSLDTSATGSAAAPPSAPTSVAATNAPGSASARASASATSRATAPPPPTAPTADDPVLRQPTFWDADDSLGANARMDGARRRKHDVVTKLYEDAGVAFPPKQLLLRGFKQEKQLEVWASSGVSGALTKIATYKICYASGELGPKREEGDAQVPEGYYRIGYFNPASSYHLSMLVSYPNASDAVFGTRGNLGGEIMIHGSCVSIGCLAMSDERIEELWVMARSARRPVHVHLYPTRDMQGLLDSGKQPEHHEFWRDIKEGYDHFEKDKVLPKVSIGRDGRYSFR